MITKVVNIQKEYHTKYIGRGSKWGNKFRIGIHGTREECIEQYEKDILSNPELLDDLEELRGEILGCFCKPKACHGDILIKLLNNRRIHNGK